MVRRLWPGVAWYLKNWVIFKIQPEGFDPSNRGTSIFIRGTCDEEEGGNEFEEEDKGGDQCCCCWVVSKMVIRWSSSSNLEVTWRWLEASLTITSSIRSKFVFDHVDSAITDSMKAPSVIGTKLEKRNRLASRARTSKRKGKKGDCIISICLFLTFK